MTVSKFCHRCGKLVERGHKHREKDRRPSARQRGYDAEWEATRLEFLRLFPTCQWRDGCLNPATQVHHRDGKGPKGPLGYHFPNLQSLCASHHSELTSREHGFK